MSDPASCVPPNPEVSGWWWLIDNDIPTPEFPVWWESIHQEWDMGDVAVTAGEIAQKGYRILGPVPSHADVVEARGQIAQDGKEIERLDAQLTAANAEIARLKHPDLVTVRREDLRELFDRLLCANWAGNPPQNGIANIDPMIKEMEEAANGT